jgi:hypothetical protein
VHAVLAREPFTGFNCAPPPPQDALAVLGVHLAHQRFESAIHSAGVKPNNG